MERRIKLTSFPISGFLFKLFCVLLFIPFIAVAAVLLLIGGIMYGIHYVGRTLLSKIGIVRRNTEIENNSIFSSILLYMLNIHRR